MDEEKFKKFLSELKFELNKIIRSINENGDRIEFLETEVAKLKKQSQA